jgi:hypothetical protein
MKERWRITIPARRRELIDLIENKLVEHDKSKALFAYTYPYASVAEKMAGAVIVAEKGQPHLWGPDKHRQTRLARVVANVQDQFDKDKSWHCRYDHEKTAAYIVSAIVRAEITR